MLYWLKMSRRQHSHHLFLLLSQNTNGLYLFVHSVILFFFPQEGKYYLRRCIDSGLWVPESGEADDKEGDEEEEEDEED